MIFLFLHFLFIFFSKWTLALSCWPTLRTRATAGDVGTSHSGTLQLPLFEATVARYGGLHGAGASSGGKAAGDVFGRPSWAPGGRGVRVCTKALPVMCSTTAEAAALGSRAVLVVAGC